MASDGRTRFLGWSQESEMGREVGERPKVKEQWVDSGGRTQGPQDGENPLLLSKNIETQNQ